jgi:hypothetical protein
MKENTNNNYLKRQAFRLLSYVGAIVAATCLLIYCIEKSTTVGGSEKAKPSSGSTPPPPPPLLLRNDDGAVAAMTNDNFCNKLIERQADLSGGESAFAGYGIFHEDHHQRQQLNNPNDNELETNLEPSSSSKKMMTFHPYNLMAGDWKYYMLCIPTHVTHEHRVTLTLKRLKYDLEMPNPIEPNQISFDKGFGEVDLYISTTNRHPSLMTSTWISRDVGDDTISLPTYVPEFVDPNQEQQDGDGGVDVIAPTRSKTLFIGVHAPSEGGSWGNSPAVATHPTKYQLSVDISDVPASEVLRRGNLRGGLGRIMEGQEVDPRVMRREAMTDEGDAV